MLYDFIIKYTDVFVEKKKRERAAFTTDRPKAALLLWFFTVVLVYICGMLSMWHLHS